MDILEQNLDPEDILSVSTKEEENSNIVMEETEMVDCDSEQVTEDGLRYPETLSYRVVQVNGAANNEIELPVTQAPLQVLTSPINGQFYVIGNANDVFTTAQTSRSVIAPRGGATLQIESSSKANSSSGGKKRDDRRRATHNEVERRRRDKINNWITKLGKIIPECNSAANSSGGEGNGKANYETQSKGGILAKACDYISDLKNISESMSQCSQDNEKLRQENTALRQLVTQLKRENTHLKSQLPTAEDIPEVSILP